jgi:hypothetical protein
MLALQSLVVFPDFAVAGFPRPSWSATEFSQNCEIGHGQHPFTVADSLAGFSGPASCTYPRIGYTQPFRRLAYPYQFR